MTQSSGRMLRTMLGMAALVGASLPVTMPAIPANVAPVRQQSKRQLLRRLGIVLNGGYLKHPPSTNAREKRAALKAKNRARHRRACRG